MSSFQDYKTRALSLHNELRQRHSAPPLQWSYQLQKEAKEYAGYLATRRDSRGQPQALELKDNVTWGQNLFELRRTGDDLDDISDTVAVERAIEFWYKDMEEYNWAQPHGGATKSGLSFSQIVWRSTEKVGMAVGRNAAADRIVVIAFYDKPGNVRGEFSINVQRADASKIGAASPQPAPTWRTTMTINTTKSNKKSGSSFPTSGGISSNPQSGGLRMPTFSSSFTSSSAPNRSNFNTTTTKTTTSTSRTSSSNKSRSSFSDDTPVPALLTTALDLHNQFRRKHGSPTLKLDPKLCIQAQRHAQAIVDNKSGESTLGLGRNSYQVRGNGLDPMEAVKAAVNKWYDQRSQYNWATPLNSRSANLFSQLIWRASQDLGVGLAVSGNGGHIAVIALYSPPGNIASEKSYRENVRSALY